MDEDARSELAPLIEAVGLRADGLAVALDILGLRFTSNQRGEGSSPSLVVIGRRILQSLSEAAIRGKQGHMLAGLLSACTSGREGEGLARHLCQLACDAVARHDLSHGLRATIGVLLRTQSDAALIVILGEAGAERDMLGRSRSKTLCVFR